MGFLKKTPIGVFGFLLCLVVTGCGSGTSSSTSSSTSGGSGTSTPSPDFSLAVSPATLTLAAGGTARTSVTATGTNGFSGTVSVAISGLPAGVTANPATLSVTSGMAQSTTLSAATGAAAATPTITFTGTSGSLSHSATLALIVKAAAPAPTPTATVPDVTTYHYDNARDGLNSQETILTPGNVNSAQFGKIGFDAVDGKVDAEPLYAASVTVGSGSHNVLYVATEHGSVYAFDADNGAQFWKTSILGANETTSDDHGCSQIAPEIGITSTPVIDRNQGPNGTLFTVGMSKDANGEYHQRLHALDLATGAETGGGPVEITASYPGTGDNSQGGNVVFDPAQYAERAGLLLLNGNIYLGWTSHCDRGLYTGWGMAYSESTLHQTQVLNLTPNAREGSIWMSGDGMAADSQGFVYLLDANGKFDTALDGNGFPASGDFGNAMLKLSTNGTLAVADYFAAYNAVSESDRDIDLGSGGELLLPDQTDANGTVRHLIVGAGKDGNIYLADRDNMGKFNPSSSPGNGNVYQSVTGQLAGMVFSTPAYFNGVLYYASDGDSLKAFPLTNAKLATTPSSETAVKFSHPGPTPSISANGSQNGIVWALESFTGNPTVLHAYDPANLAHEFYNSTQAANGRDTLGLGNKFITPMIVNGKVYVGMQNGVAVFGLLGQ